MSVLLYQFPVFAEWGKDLKWLELLFQTDRAVMLLRRYHQPCLVSWKYFRCVHIALLVPVAPVPWKEIKIYRCAGYGLACVFLLAMPAYKLLPVYFVAFSLLV